ncbi:MAG: hypothetical protein C0467_08105 [Planctomycetaceae bacterium]|nr:hypothetical protein [Planctomycetaceae bacterium]
MKNKELFKKHHFWILLGIVPLFVLIAAITISSNVGAAVDKKLSDYKSSESSITSKLNPKSEELIKRIKDQVARVESKKDELWRLNWERQKDMYVWPNSPRLKDIERLNLAFGKTIPYSENQYEEFKKPEVYLAEFSTANAKKGIPPSTGMADTLAPTQFLNGWQSVLRHVNVWDDRALTSEQIWLMMEDIWIQRSLLDAVRSVNAQMAEFRRVKYEKDGVVIDDPEKKTPDDPLRRKFHSRIWDLELEVVPKGNSKVLVGRLINHTDRLQLMGLNNTMIVKVWLQPGKDVRPFEFKIGGEFLAGKGAMKADGKTPANVLNIVPTDDHIIPPTLDVAEIVKVEQVFDARTVPVRRIEAMQLGKTDSRFADKQILMPKFPAFEKEEIKKEDPLSPKGPGGTPVFLPPPGGLDQPGGVGGVGGVGGKSGGGTVDTVVNANKKRYVAVTGEVRRMPVAIALVVDQAYMQDVLLAFANSQLKFQITQANWARFRGTLGSGVNDPKLDPLSGGSVLFAQPGAPNALGGEFRDPELRGPKPIGPPPVGPRPLPGPGGPGSPGGPFGLSGNLTTVSESQLTSGLIELSVYGVVSLYEKFVAAGEVSKDPVIEPKPKDKEPKVDPKAKGAEPKAKEPVVPDPKTKVEPKATEPKTKDPEPVVPDPKTPKQPAVPDPKTPKSRRRRIC